MIKKIVKWWRVKMVKRVVVRDCEREAIKNDFEAELNRQPVEDLGKEVNEMQSAVKAMEHDAEEARKNADAIYSDETMQPEGRREKSKELKAKARQIDEEIEVKKKLMADYLAAIKSFERIVAERRKLAASLRIKAEFIRTNY